MPSGIYRRVFLVAGFAIKIPRLVNFRAGRYCNVWEREMWSKWRPEFRWETLCPVLLADPFGLLVVMPRVQPVTFEEVQAADGEIDYYPDIDVEYKAENWGRLGGEIVCIDFGLPEVDMIRDRRKYLSSRSSASR